MTIMNETDYTKISLEKLPLDENIDIGNIYTPDYFKQFDLVAYTSDMVDEKEMVGGYFQPIKNLTKPYQYFVYLAEPFTFTLPTFKKAENSTLAFQPPPKAVEVPPVVETEEKKTSSFIFDFSKIKNMFLKPEYQDKQPMNNPPVAVAEPVQPLSVLPIITTTIDPSLNTMTQPDPPQIEETTPNSDITPTVESPKKSLLYIKIKHQDIDNNPFQKKTVQEIIEFYKDTPRTIITFQNNLTYNLVESVIKDIHIGLLYMLKTFGLTVKTINLQSCYYINQRYIYLDNHGFVIVGKNDIKNQEIKISQIIKECIETLIGNSKIEHTYLYKQYMMVE